MGFGGYLQANTAVDVLIGPFVDDTDGKTAETALTLSQADIKLSKNGQALAQKNDDTTAAHDANGYYNCELDATDTNTEGMLTLIVHESGALPVRHDFMVLAQAAYTSLVTAKDTGYMDINVKAVSEDTTAADNLESYCDGTTPIPSNATQISGDATAADNAEAFFDGTGYAGTNNTIPTVTSVTNMVSANMTQISGDATAADNLEAACDGTTYNIGGGAVVAASVTGAVGSVTGAVGSVTGNVGGNVVGSVASVTGAVASVTGSVGSVAAGGITATSIATGAIDADSLAADAVNEIVDQVWDELLVGHAGAGSTGEALSAAGTAGDPWTTALPGAYGAGTAGKLIGDNINATISSRASQTSVDTIAGYLDTEIAAILADTNELQTDLTNGGRLDLLVDAIKAKTDNLPADPADDSDIDAQLATIAGYLDTEVAAILAAVDTEIGTLTTELAKVPKSDGTSSWNATALAAIQSECNDALVAYDPPTKAELDTAIDAVPTATENADALLNRDMSAVSDTNSRSPLNALRFLRNKWALAGVTLSVKKEDDTTEAWSATVTTDAAAEPITGADPA